PLPAQSASSPAPVTIASHCSGSAEKSSSSWLSSKCASICSALYTSGRDSVTIVIGPLRVSLENFRSMFAPVGFGVEGSQQYKRAVSTDHHPIAHGWWKGGDALWRSAPCATPS